MNNIKQLFVFGVCILLSSFLISCSGEDIHDDSAIPIEPKVENSTISSPPSRAQSSVEISSVINDSTRNSLKSYCDHSSSNSSIVLPISFSKNGSGFAFIEANNGDQTMVFNGKRFFPRNGNFTDIGIDISGTRIGYIGSSNISGAQRYVLVLNGMDVGNYFAGYTGKKLNISADGTKLIFGRIVEGSRFSTDVSSYDLMNGHYGIDVCDISNSSNITCNNVFLGEVSNLLLTESFLIFTDSMQFIITKINGDGTKSLIKDGVQLGESYSDILGDQSRVKGLNAKEIAISRDGMRVAFGGMIAGINKYELIEDGVDKGIEIVTPPIFSDDSKNIAYIKKVDGFLQLQKNGVDIGSPLKGDIKLFNLTFSPTNDLYFVGFNEIEKEFLLFREGEVIFKNKGSSFLYPYFNLQFLPNGKSILFLGEDRAIIIDGKDTGLKGTYDNSLAYSADGNNWLLRIKNDDGSQSLLKNGVKLPEKYQSINEMAVSPDGKSFAYSILNNSEVSTIKDGAFLSGQRNPIYSPNGEFFTIKVDNGVSKLFLNGKNICDPSNLTP